MGQVLSDHNPGGCAGVLFPAPACSVGAAPVPSGGAELGAGPADPEVVALVGVDGA